ncbi:MAG: type II secretion system protein [Candidatus Peregrinibacteria bacterium]
MKNRFTKGGFTLIELLLVIGIIAILASIVIVAINPTKQLGDARDASRRSDVNTILNAVYQYAIDHNGKLPGDNTDPKQITTDYKGICRTTETADCTGLARLHALSGAYLVALPVDPQEDDLNKTGYEIKKDANGRVSVKATAPEIATSIEVTR